MLEVTALQTEPQPLPTSFQDFMPYSIISNVSLLPHVRLPIVVLASGAALTVNGDSKSNRPSLNRSWV